MSFNEQWIHVLNVFVKFHHLADVIEVVILFASLDNFGKIKIADVNICKCMFSWAVQNKIDKKYLNIVFLWLDRYWGRSELCQVSNFTFC